MLKFLELQLLLLLAEEVDAEEVVAAVTALLLSPVPLRCSDVEVFDFTSKFVAEFDIGCVTFICG